MTPSLVLILVKFIFLAGLAAVALALIGGVRRSIRNSNL